MLEIKSHKSVSCGPSSEDKGHEKLVNQGRRHTHTVSQWQRVLPVSLVLGMGEFRLPFVCFLFAF